MATERNRAEEITESSKTLLSYYTSQIPAHASYIVTSMIGFFTTLIGVVFVISSPINWTRLGIIFGFAVFSILTLGYFFGRLAYYNELIALLDDVLGINTQETRRRYLALFDLCLNGEKGEEDRPFSTLVQCEILYRIDNIKGKSSTVKYKKKGIKAWLMRRVFCRQLSNENFRAFIRIIDHAHSMLDG